VLAAVTIAVFFGALNNGWIRYDDPHYVYDNPHVNVGWTWEGVRWFLHRQHGGNWHPLTSYSHMLDVELFGLVPRGHHAVSVALHALNAALLWWVLARFTGGWWRSGLVAALFALHPLRVESVAWVSERKDVLSTLFFLLTLESYRRWTIRPGPLRLALVTACLAMGLASKPMLVTVPAVLILLDVWPLGRLVNGPAAAIPTAGLRKRSLTGLVAEKWPLFLVVAASGIVTFLVQRQAGAVVSVQVVTPLRRFANAWVSYWRYLGKSFWPTDLAVFYPNNREIGLAAAAVAALGLIAASWLAWRWARRRPYLAVGWAWYLLTLLPVIGLIQVGGQAYADRYTYLTTIGIAIALVWGLADLVGERRAARGLATVAALAALAGLSLATLRQVALWKDTRTLFRHALAVTRDNPIPHQYLGGMDLEEGDLQGALAHFREAARIAPLFHDAHNKLGITLGALGHYDEAVAELREGIRLRDSGEARHNLAHTYEKQGRIPEAMRAYEEALEKDPDLLLSLTRYGALLVAAGRVGEAEPYLRRALRLRPDAIEVRRLLAAGLTAGNRADDGVREYREILARDPNDLDALVNVAWIRATHADPARRDGAEAVRLAERARDHSPEPQAVVFSTLAAAYAEAGRFAEAVTAGERAVALALAANERDAAQRYRAQLDSYRRDRPFHFAAP
jgi:tetratricopeptide (TPR) repeat protein